MGDTSFPYTFRIGIYIQFRKCAEILHSIPDAKEP